MTGLDSGKILSDVPFQLLDTNTAGEIVNVRYQGAWVIVDNGYLNKSICMPPMKHAITRSQLRWSEWVESMRKDVECTFGIMKKRWAILNEPIRLQGVKKADRIWKTCCALHNLLLIRDGLDKEWDGGISTNPTTQGSYGNTPFAIQRLHSTDIPASIVHNTNHTDNNGDNENTEISLDNVNIVRNLSPSDFQSKLIKHFDISFHQHKIVWPSRSTSAATLLQERVPR